jgi:NADPH:quinone reductase-like Zn-dependent oxidoreductase
MMMKGAWMRGIFVGSGRMATDLNRAIDVNGMKPVIDKVFPFDQARQAYEYQASGSLFGKVVISL